LGNLVKLISDIRLALKGSLSNNGAYLKDFINSQNNLVGWQNRVLRTSFFVYLLYLNGKTGILLLDSITNSIVFQLVLLKLMAHHVVTILDRALYLLLASLREIELHYGIIFEL
jgi:hypothetical protein